jgi:hypothetical protein
MSANKQFKAMAHYPVFCHFGKAPKEKFGRPGNHRVNSRKKYQLTPKIRTLSQVPTHLYPPHFISAQEAKTAKVAQYPVTDDTRVGYGVEHGSAIATCTRTRPHPRPGSMLNLTRVLVPAHRKALDTLFKKKLAGGRPKINRRRHQEKPPLLGSWSMSGVEFNPIGLNLT